MEADISGTSTSFYLDKILPPLPRGEGTKTRKLAFYIPTHFILRFPPSPLLFKTSIIAGMGMVE